MKVANMKQVNPISPVRHCWIYSDILLPFWLVMGLLLTSHSLQAASPVSGKLTGLVAQGLMPAFDPTITQYTVPAPSNCLVSITATVADPTNPNLKLSISNTSTTSGKVVNAWVCNGKTPTDIVIYDVWTVVGHYTITPVTTPVQRTIVGSYSIDKLTAAQFLANASFGPTPDSIAAVQSQGLTSWLAAQAKLPASAIADGLNTNQVISQVFLNMYQGADQLRQRMIFALSQTLVVSANKDVYGDELIPWVRLLSIYAFGNYRDLLRAAALSPSMAKYLDLANSQKVSGNIAPNENFPRELMQLFTIGTVLLNQDGSLKLDAYGQPIPTYNQKTVVEYARALTGWTYPTVPGTATGVLNQENFVGLMEPRSQYHDTGTKTLVNGQVIPAGQSVNQDLESVLDSLFQHPNVPPFLATRLIHSLVTSNPTSTYIKRVADVFVDNGKGVRGDLWAVLTAVLTDSEAIAVPSFQQGHLKDPIRHVISLGRALNAQITDPNQFMYLFDSLGQKVLTPPSVFSFYSPLGALPNNPNLYGPEFQLYSPGMVIQRANLIYSLLSTFNYDSTPFNAVANDSAALVEKVNQTLLQGQMSDSLRQTLTTLTKATPDTANRVLGVLYLAAISSEYAVELN